MDYSDGGTYTDLFTAEDPQFVSPPQWDPTYAPAGGNMAEHDLGTYTRAPSLIRCYCSTG